MFIFGRVEDTDFFELKGDNCNSFLNIDIPFNLLRASMLKMHKVDLLTFLN